MTSSDQHVPEDFSTTIARLTSQLEACHRTIAAHEKVIAELRAAGKAAAEAAKPPTPPAPRPAPAAVPAPSSSTGGTFAPWDKRKQYRLEDLSENHRWRFWYAQYKAVYQTANLAKAAYRKFTTSRQTWRKFGQFFCMKDVSSLSPKRVFSACGTYSFPFRKNGKQYKPPPQWLTGDIARGCQVAFDALKNGEQIPEERPANLLLPEPSAPPARELAPPAPSSSAQASPSEPINLDSDSDDDLPLGELPKLGKRPAGASPSSSSAPPEAPVAKKRVFIGTKMDRDEECYYCGGKPKRTCFLGDTGKRGFSWACPSCFEEHKDELPVADGKLPGEFQRRYRCVECEAWFLGAPHGYTFTGSPLCELSMEGMSDSGDESDEGGD